MRPGEHRTIEQVADAAGLSVDLLRRVVTAAGVRIRDDDFRDAEEFFHTVARVRELLHAGPAGSPAVAAARGLENR